MPLVFATVVIGLVGLGIQQVLLRWNQGQDLRQALITIAVSVIIADQLLAHYGGIVETHPAADELAEQHCHRNVSVRVLPARRGAGRGDRWSGCCCTC